jgi:hypothetical protein
VASISVYIYIYNKRGRDEIPTGKIAFRKKLLNLKHKILYTVKTTSIHV